MDNATGPWRGLHLDGTRERQPPGTYTYALNAVAATDAGDMGMLANERGSAPCGSLPTGHVPIGSADMGEGGTVVFSVNGAVSEIGLLDRDCRYATLVNDSGSAPADRLGFRLEAQVQAVYRLRLGCRRTVYFTDGHNRPRVFDMDGADAYRNADGTWNGRLFALQRSPASLPIFREVEVLDSGGALLPGGYNIAVQYMDGGMNPTDWLASSPVAQVYHDLPGKTYREVRGSTGQKTDYTDGSPTGKALRVSLDGLDRSFPYYRLAFIGATTGDGRITAVRTTAPLPTTEPHFTYTGNNAEGTADEMEIAMQTAHIETAETIASLGDRLHLGNTRGKGANYCRLQKYASRIRADCATRQVSLDEMQLDRGNPRSAVHEFHGLGYMPGEIYSFGIAYLFADGTYSPVYHIPGRSPHVPAGAVFVPGNGAYPMSGDNALDSLYTAGSGSCGGGSGYWGRDSEGFPLEGTPVRHHRFPLRSEIGLPLVRTDKGESAEVTYRWAEIKIAGPLLTPAPCPEDDLDCDDGGLKSFEVRVAYTVGGEARTYTFTVNPSAHTEGQQVVGGVAHTMVDIGREAPWYAGDIVIGEVSISDANGLFHPLGSGAGQYPYSNEHGNYFLAGSPAATVTASLGEKKLSSGGRRHSAEILGVRFSGIDMPLPDETNGHEVVGYRIVRSTRREEDRTVLDTGALLPTMVNKNYVGHGLLCPETHRASESVHALLHPEHKFNGREYMHYDELVQEGEFEVVDRKYGKVNYDDVMEGSSFDEKHHSKSWNDDGNPDPNNTWSMDGWSLNIISRDNILEYRTKRDGFRIPAADISERFYLSALESRTAGDGITDVWNITTDNRAGIVITDALPKWNGRIPYVALRKENKNVYSNFRELPYHGQGPGPVLFSAPGADACTLFSGDSYISPLRYVNTVFYDNRVAFRGAKKQPWWKVIAGPVLILFGTALAFLTGGTSLLLISGGLAMMGVGVLMVSSGIKMENFARAYEDAYKKGLRETALDDWVDAFYNYKYNARTQAMGFAGGWGHGEDGPSDDTIQWVGDCLTDLWFEGAVNANLRYGIASGDSPSFLPAPGPLERGNDSPLVTIRGTEKSTHYMDSNAQRYPVSSLERHLAQKLLVFDGERDDGKAYLGLALGEMYAVNPDYQRGNLQRPMFHLPLGYDCCSDCQEAFPHRWHWSERSFQEELSDGYRVLLPNNYKDIPGELGPITNIFAMGQDLFLHAREALWMQPAGDRQQVAGDIVSHIGTGDLGSLPARRVAGGGGLRHRWGAMATEMGYFFVSEGEGRVYRFDGQSLQDLSALGMSRWFRENVPLLCDRGYERESGKPYPYADNPSNPYGTGFVLALDRDLGRLLVTKRDFVLDAGLSAPGSYLHVCTDGSLVHFPDYWQEIEARRGAGWEFLGMEGCAMKFGRTTTVRVEEERTVETSGVVPSQADIWVFLDTSGSFSNAHLNTIENAVEEWRDSIAAANPNWTGTLRIRDDSTERWLSYPKKVMNSPEYGGDVSDRDVIIISFCNESHPNYHNYDDGAGAFPITPPTGQFMYDYNDFVSNVFPAYRSFAGIVYPIATMDTSRAYVLHTIAAVHGTVVTALEAATELSQKNPYFTDAEWASMLLSLQTANPYPDDGLRNYNWAGKWDRHAFIGESVIDPARFQQDIEDLLHTIDVNTTEVVVIEVDKAVEEYEHVQGVPAGKGMQMDASWTVSLSLGQGGMPSSWTSWHSYLPAMYLHSNHGLSSWAHGGGSAFWRHGEKGYYQRFYGKQWPHVLEAVSLPGAPGPHVWDGVLFLTRAEGTVDGGVVDLRHETHNGLVAYNSRQCTGLLPIADKERLGDAGDYLCEQVRDGSMVLLDRNEGIWAVNGLRDIRTDYGRPIWLAGLSDRQADYYTDKMLDTAGMDKDKDWTEMEPLRDRYLVVRLSYDVPSPAHLLTGPVVGAHFPSAR